ncbi:MAG: hypothetical protein N2482_02445 [Patescibacteria group bacterium]|nr:hypothetical protein [Patescibacteria group bacterium]
MGSNPIFGSMTRLENYHKKQFYKKLILFIFLFIILFFLFFNWGVKIIFNSAIFISRLIKKNEETVIIETNNPFYGNLTIDSLPNATNSAKVIISGTLTNFEIVEFYLNNEKIKEIETIEKFEEELEELKEGENEIYLIAKTKDKKHIKKSSKYTVLFKKEKPKLEIIEPTDNFKTDKEEIKILGKTDKEVMIKINDLPIVVDAQGSFQTFIKLKEGENKIDIEALDIAGNLETKTLTVVYQKE